MNCTSAEFRVSVFRAWLSSVYGNLLGLRLSGELSGSLLQATIAMLLHSHGYG